jgi:hypothetical protein
MEKDECVWEPYTLGAEEGLWCRRHAHFIPVGPANSFPYGAEWEKERVKKLIEKEVRK